MTIVIARVHPVHLMNVHWAPGGCQPSDQASRLGCESAENWQLSSTSTIATVIITQPASWYSFYRPTKGGRLSRPKHCSKGAQPMLKTVYRSSCRDKHNCQWRDSNLDPLTLQSDVLNTRLLRYCILYEYYSEEVANVSYIYLYPCAVDECSPTFCGRLLHCESKKTRHQTLGHNFTNYYPIFKIFSLMDLVINFK